MLQGSLDNFSLSEVLGLLASTEKTGRLRVSGDRGTGSLWLEDGQLISGAGPDEAQTGIQDVVFEIMRFKSGNFSFAVNEAPAEAELPQLVDIVVATAGDQLAEWHQIEAVVPSLDHILTPRPELDGEQVTITSEQWRMLIAVGPRSAVREVCSDLGLGEVDGSRMMKVMIEQGLLDITEDARGRSDDAGAEADVAVAQPAVTEAPVVEAPVVEAPPVAAPVAAVEVQAAPEPVASDVDAMFTVGEVTAEMPPVVDTPVADMPVSEPVEEPAASSLPPMPAAPVQLDDAFPVDATPPAPAPIPIPEPRDDVDMPPPPTAAPEGTHTPESLAQSLVDSMADGAEPGYTAPVAQDSPDVPAPSLTDMFANPVADEPADVVGEASPAAAHADDLVGEVVAADLPSAPHPNDLIEHASFEDASAFLGDDVPPPPPAPRAERTEGMMPPPPAPTESDLSSLTGSDLDDIMPPPPGVDTPPSPGEIDSFRNSISDSSDLDSFSADSFSADSSFSASANDEADMFSTEDPFDAGFGDLEADVAPATLGGMLDDEHETEEKGSSLLMRYLKSER